MPEIDREWLFGPTDMSRYPGYAMAAEDENLVVASVDVDRAVATQTAIDEDELENARLDRRWHDFCLNAEQYVAETTRPRPRVGQTA